MAANRIEALDGMFDDHPSLSASLEDFEHNENRSPLFGLPSQHSGFKSDDSEIDAESNSDGPWSPPAWRRQNAGSGWYQHQPYLEAPLRPSLPTSPSRSRETSPQYESAREDEEDITLPANIPLPRDTISPSKEPSPSPSLYPERGQDFAENFGQTEQAAVVPENTNNCVQFYLCYSCKTVLTVAKISDLRCAQKCSIEQSQSKLRSLILEHTTDGLPNQGAARPLL